MTDPKLPPDTTIIDIADDQIVSSLTVTHTPESISFVVQVNYPVDDDASES